MASLTTQPYKFFEFVELSNVHKISRLTTAVSKLVTSLSSLYSFHFWQPFCTTTYFYDWHGQILSRGPVLQRAYSTYTTHQSFYFSNHLYWPLYVFIQELKCVQPHLLFIINLAVSCFYESTFSARSWIIVWIIFCEYPLIWRTIKYNLQTIFRIFHIKDDRYTSTHSDAQAK